MWWYRTYILEIFVNADFWLQSLVGSVRRVCSLGDVAKPGVPRERLVAAVDEEDAGGEDKLH